jgi:hypothetical protein
MLFCDNNKRIFDLIFDFNSLIKFFKKLIFDLIFDFPKTKEK